MARSRLGDIVRTILRRTGQPQSAPPATPTATSTRTSASTPARNSTPAGVSYAPRLDGRPDPGEVVWAWVPYEDDPAQGKDRPVLVVGRDGAMLLGLQLTSKDHDFDAADEARYGRHWMDIGSGGWDSDGRPSEVRLDRLLRLEESEVRREGAALDRALFDAVIDAAKPYHQL